VERLGEGGADEPLKRLIQERDRSLRQGLPSASISTYFVPVSMTESGYLVGEKNTGNEIRRLITVLASSHLLLLAPVTEGNGHASTIRS
jgi:hypothetical protein